IYFGEFLYERLRDTRVLRAFGAFPTRGARRAEEALHDHVTVVGMNSLGGRLGEELAERGARVLATDTDAEKLARLRCDTLLGSVDHQSVLDEANLGKAKLVVSALQIEDTNNLLAFRCRTAGVPCSIHAFDRSVVDELRRIGVSHLMIPKNNGIKR